MKKTAQSIMLIALFAVVLSACGHKMIVPTVEKMTAAQELETVPDLTFPEEASSVVFYTVTGVDAAWGWRKETLKEETIPGLFYQKDQLLFAGKPVQGLESLTANGYFDKNGYAQNMTVQGWSGNIGDKPVFQIFLYRLDSKLMRTDGRSPENAAENLIYEVPVKTSWSDTDGIAYCASFETADLSIQCVTTATEYRNEAEARALLRNIVAHCLNSDYGVTIG